MILGNKMVFTFSDLQKWITEWESPALEFKLSVQKDAGSTISAFANTYGGILVFGVNPKSKELKGLENPDKESIRLREIIDQCRPYPKPTQEFLRHEGKTFIILKIDSFSYSENPCFYGDSCFIRQGTTNMKLRGDELVEFLKKRALINFEELKNNATLSDLDFEKVNTLLKRRSIKTSSLKEEEYRGILAGLGVANYSGEFFLKNVALFFFAKNPERFFNNLQVRIVKYAGTEADLRILKMDKQIKGTLPDLVNESFDFILDNIGKTFTLSGTERKELPDYPAESLRELLTNAIGHRDYFKAQEVLVEIYEDRLQITNPGGLLAGQDIKDFDKTPQHRNPITYRLLRDSGLGEGLGLGVRLIRRQFREAGLPDPEFYTIGNTFQAIIYNNSSRLKRHPVDFVSPRQKHALAYLSKSKSMKAAQYAKMVGVTQATAVKDLNELVKQGKIRKIGKYRGAYYEIEDKLKVIKSN